MLIESGLGMEDERAFEMWDRFVLDDVSEEDMNVFLDEDLKGGEF